MDNLQDLREAIEEMPEMWGSQEADETREADVESIGDRDTPVSLLCHAPPSPESPDPLYDAGCLNGFRPIEGSMDVTAEDGISMDMSMRFRQRLAETEGAEFNESEYVRELWAPCSSPDPLHGERTLMQHEDERDQSSLESLRRYTDNPRSTGDTHPAYFRLDVSLVRG